MKLFLLATIALAFPGTSSVVAKGDSRPFGSKSSKTRKSQHGMFAAKASKTVSQSIVTVDESAPLNINGTSSPIDDEGRHPKNSEDGGLVLVDGTDDAAGSEAVEEEEEDDSLLNETFGDDDVSPSTQGFDPANAMFEWLKGCAEADLDKDTCLVTKTLDALVNMDGHSQDDDATFPSKRRVLQEEGCRPDMSEQDLRNIMNGSRADCMQVAIGYSDGVFEGMFMEFWKVLSSDNCWNELCESPDIFLRLMFDHAVQCANVDFDVDQCITDEIFSMMFAEPTSHDDDEHYYATDDGLTNHTHRVLLRSLQEVVNGDTAADCVLVNEVDLTFMASFVLMEAQGRCDELGVLVTTEDISKASADLVKLFASPHCWGDVHACPEVVDDDDDDDDNYVEEEEEDDALLNETFDDDDVSPSTTQGFDPTNDAMFEWLKGCAGADLDKDTCLVTKTLDSFVNMDGHSQDDDATFPSKRRVLQEEGCRPDMSEQDLRDLMNGSRAECNQVAIGYSDEVFEGILGEFWKVFSADSCWTELCNSPDILFKLMFDHAVKCANVDFDVDHCIMDQIFSMMFAEPTSYDDDDYYYATDDSLANHTHRVLRSLQNVVNGDTAADCVVVNEVDLAFMASFVLMEAQGRCAELGVLVTTEDISKASADLVQLFASPHCWGDVHACPEGEGEVNDDNNYLDVLEPNEVGDGNMTSLANSTSSSETTSTQPAGISPANEANVATLSNDDTASNTNTTTFDEQSSENGDGALNNGTAGILEDDEATTEEDNISSSVIEEGDITDANHTSVEGGINATWATDDDHLSVSTESEGDADEASAEEDANDLSTEVGVNGTSAEKDLSESALDDANDSSNNGQEEDNVTSTEEGSGSIDDIINSTEVEGGEEDPFSIFIPPENGTAPIFNPSTSENATIPSSSDNSTGSIFTPQVTSESCDVGPRSGISERSIQMPYYYIIETIILEGVADEIEGMLHLMMCINGVDRRLSVVSGETSIVALESSPKDVVSTECKLILPLCLS